MATFNGQPWVVTQLQSILEQLGSDDEVVVVDDASTDGTVSLIEQIGDDRIRVLSNEENAGHVSTFERALSEARGDIVFLSDQDDLWIPGRVRALLEGLNGATVVASNFEVLGQPDRGSNLRRAGSRKTGNLVDLMLGTAPYFGCTMAMRREFLDVLLPFPDYTEAHDHWIAVAANVRGQMYHLGSATVQRRLHGGNMTPVSRRNLGAVLRTRVLLLRLVVEALRRT